MEKSFKIKLPKPPNFLIIEIPGSSGETTIPVSALTESEARKMADDMFNQFLDHWRKKTTQAREAQLSPATKHLCPSLQPQP